MRLVFAGTPEFAAVLLRSLLERGHDLGAVYTQPDRPAGRGRRIEMSAVKRVALEHDLEVHQPRSLRDPQAQAELLALAPELMVVVAYGLLLPQTVLSIPERGCVNVHASLLPRWRGAAPIQRAIQAGDEYSGVCIMRMEATLDTGPVVRRARVRIEPDDTAGTLHDRLATLGSQALDEALNDIATNRAVETEQDHAKATYAHRITKEEGRIDWSEPAATIERKVRAFNPWPVCFTASDAESGEERLRIWHCSVLEDMDSAGTTPGTVVQAGADGFAVATGEGALLIDELQPAGKRRMRAADYLNAHPLRIGSRLR